jgi:hypothetical protein
VRCWSDYHGQRDEDALVRLWRDKRGEVEPEDLSGDLIVQLGVATETLNRRRGHTGQVITPAARKARKPGVDGGHPLMGAEATGAVFEAKFMLPWLLGGGGGRKVYTALQHNMCGWRRPGRQRTW